MSRLRAALPPELGANLLEVIEKTGELVLLVGQSVWAGRLRLALPELAGVAGGRRLVVKVSPRPPRR